MPFSDLTRHLERVSSKIAKCAPVQTRQSKRSQWCCTPCLVWPLPSLSLKLQQAKQYQSSLRCYQTQLPAATVHQISAAMYTSQNQCHQYAWQVGLYNHSNGPLSIEGQQKKSQSCPWQLSSKHGHSMISCMVYSSTLSIEQRQPQYSSGQPQNCFVSAFFTCAPSIS